MKKLVALAVALSGLGSGSVAQSPKLDYDQLIHLDAEDLAESGVKEAYAKVRPALQRYVRKPTSVEETLDSNAPSYSVASNGIRYEIYGPDTPTVQSWGNATFALFSIVNGQLSDSKFRFYAINGGNDLGGMFLTESQAKAAMASLKKKTDWPYIPTKEHPWYGQQH